MSRWNSPGLAWKCAARNKFILHRLIVFIVPLITLPRCNSKVTPGFEVLMTVHDGDRRNLRHPLKTSNTPMLHPNLPNFLGLIGVMLRICAMTT